VTPDLSSSGIPQDRVAVIAAIYRDSAAKLRAIILTPPGKTSSAQAWNQARASQQLHQVEKLIADLKSQAAAWVGDHRDGSSGPVTQAVKDGIARANQQAIEAGVSPEGGMSGSFHLIDRQAVEFFAREIAIDLGKAADGMGETAKKALRTTAQLKLPEADINRILAGGVIAGKPVETIRQLRESLRAVHGDTVTIKDKNGDDMHFSAGAYASLVVRTQTRAATTHARHNRLQEMDLDLVAIIGRISKSFCTAFLGQVFSLSGKSAKYPSYKQLPGGGPPFHPNCSKSTRPFIEELASATQLDRADGLDDAHGLLVDSPTVAQRKFQDLQLHSQVREAYGSKDIYGVPSTAPQEQQRQAARKASPKTEEPLTVQKGSTATVEAPATKPASTAVQKASDTTERLRAKLEATRAARAEAMAKVEALREQVAALRQQLRDLVARGNARTAQITAMEKQIAAAESVIASYERAVKRREAQE
jgi:hypothetical protein